MTVCDAVGFPQGGVRRRRPSEALVAIRSKSNTCGRVFCLTLLAARELCRGAVLIVMRGIRKVLGLNHCHETDHPDGSFTEPVFENTGMGLEDRSRPIPSNSFEFDFITVGR